MGTCIPLLLTLFTLYLFINFSPVVNAARRPWTTDDRSGDATRRIRSADRPLPINCQLGRWSPWSPCNDCTDNKIRFRYLEKPSQFGGTVCGGTLWEKLACPNATIPCLVPDYCGESFTCKDSGRCISQSLRCNGEIDCEDFSDEDDCEKINQREDKCSNILPIPGAKRGTQGYNILTEEFMDHVLDPKYFGGKCEYVYNGEWRKFIYDAFCENLHYNEDEKNYRKPYNYHTYRFVAQATSEGSQEYYNDVVDLLNARKTMSSGNLGFTVGIQYVEFGLSGSGESEFLNNITKHKGQPTAKRLPNSKLLNYDECFWPEENTLFRNLGFVRLYSKVETAHFKIRSNKLMLHEDFYVSLMELPELPEQYDFGMYARFFRTFGTHYVTEGTMGGTLEYVVVVNKTAMAESDMQGEQLGGCLGFSIGLGFPISTGLSGKAKAEAKPCLKIGSFDKDSLSRSSLIEDVVTLVKGGNTDTGSGLLAIRNPETYRRWGATLKYNPALIHHETMPIYELVRLSTAADHVGMRLANLKRGWEEYMQQFDSCRCAPCRHNGIPILTGTSCNCVCKSGYQGEACEETERRDAKTDGSWSCWGAWSVRTSTKKTRTRTCNNPAPSGGGAACLGSSSQTQHC